MKATLFLAGLFAVSGLCSPIDDKKTPASHPKKLKSGTSKEFTNLKIDPNYAPVSDLWSTSGARFLEEIKGTGGKQVVTSDITAKRWKAKVQAACHAKSECVGYYINTADDDGPASTKKYRFGYLFKGSVTAKDFEKSSSSSSLKKSSSSSSLKKSSSSSLKKSSSSDENGTSTSGEGEGEAYPYPNIRGASAYKKKAANIDSNSN